LEKDRIVQKLMVSDTIPEFYTSFENQITVQDRDQLKSPFKKISDTLIYDTIENDFIPFRKLETNIQLYTRTYKIDVSKSLINKGDLISDILLLMSFLFVSLLIILMLVNFFISRKLLAPFYTTMGIIKNYEVTKSQSLNLPETNTKEFALLNEVLNIMSKKIHSDFLSLKEFTENASHEMQTPLSIIKAKLELLIQDETLSCEQLKLIQSISESATRLSKMSRALVLITRIESLQFKETRPVNVNQSLDKLLENFTELIHEKGIEVSKEYKNQLIVTINPMLVEILLTNLLSNAIKHNLSSGKIIINIVGRELIIINTGKDLDNEPDELFGRFIKDKSKPDSLGLGLSIVKKIVETNKMRIDYSFDKGYHILHVFFDDEKHP
ncbi:MAG: HAMP domain-containing sensor histidine kinase, partial [Bacteroidota bacterium]